MKKKKLTPREKRFCELYASCANAREAASRAGYRMNPEQTGLCLLERDDITDRIKKVRQSFEFAGEAAAGLKRVAFGSVSDPIKLLFADGLDPDQIERLDLFNVAEIKRPRGGGLEIKFFDRVKALEKLSEICSDNCEPVSPFYDALIKGAGLISSTGDEEQ